MNRNSKIALVAATAMLMLAACGRREITTTAADNHDAGQPVSERAVEMSTIDRNVQVYEYRSSINPNMVCITTTFNTELSTSCAK